MPRHLILRRRSYVPTDVVHWSRHTLRHARFSRPSMNEVYLENSDGPIQSYSSAVLRERTERIPLTHKADRLSLLQKLHVPSLDSALKPGTANVLARTVSRARQLRHVVLGGDGRADIFDDSPALRTSVYGLRNLKSLEIRFPSPSLLGLLARFRSRLNHLSIIRWDKPEVQPLPFLSPLSDTLKSLELNGVDSLDSPLELGFPMPRVRRLKLTDSNVPDIFPLISTFPNARRVILDDAVTDLDLPSDQDATRLRNAQSQQTARWPALDLLSGDLRSLYVHAVASRAHALQVAVDGDRGLEDREVSMLNSVLHDAQPERLSLFFSKIANPALLPLALESSPPLEHLSFFIYIDYSTTKNLFSETLERVFEVAARHPLTSLNVRLHEANITYDLSDDNPNMLFAVGLDSECLARRFVRTVPTLQRLFLSTPTDDRLRGWEVVGGAPRELGFRAVKEAAREEGVRD